MAKKTKIKPAVDAPTYPVVRDGVTGYTDSNGTWHPGKPPE